MTESEQAAAERRQGEGGLVDEGVHHEAALVDEGGRETKFVTVGARGFRGALRAPSAAPPTADGLVDPWVETEAAQEGSSLRFSEAPTYFGVRTNGTANTPETSRAAKVSAAKALVAIRRRTGRPIPADVLQLAQQD